MKVVVAVPAKDEAARIGACVAALAGQHGLGDATLSAVVACNDCTDGTAAAAHAAGGGLDLRVAELTLPPALAHAGGARRAAMERAAAIAGTDGLVLTTDADCVPDPDWVSQHLAAFAPGIAAVAGRVSADMDEMLALGPAALAVGDAEWTYQCLSAEAEARLDPVPHDPWPRHNARCGANLGVRADWYARVGGMPAIPCGEDRAFLATVEAAGGLVRHAIGPNVTASARLIGRATGGMADALARRRAGAGYVCDELLEPAADLVRRATWRAAARRAHADRALRRWAQRAGLASHADADAVPFGRAWAAIESANETLARRRLHPDALAAETAALRDALARPDA